MFHINAMLDSILNDRNIPHAICSYNDLVYDGIYQMVKGWGYVSSADFYSQEIVDILNDIPSLQMMTDLLFQLTPVYIGI